MQLRVFCKIIFLLCGFMVQSFNCFLMHWMWENGKNAVLKFRLVRLSDTSEQSHMFKQNNFVILRLHQNVTLIFKMCNKTLATFYCWSCIFSDFINFWWVYNCTNTSEHQFKQTYALSAEIRFHESNMYTNFNWKPQAVLANAAFLRVSWWLWH